MGKTLTFRARSPRMLARLEQRAKLTQIPKTALANRYVEEGLAMDLYPGIVFRDGPAGRRPAVMGGPDVWEVIEVFVAEDRDVRAAAEHLNLRPGLVDAAIAYYADNRETIDDFIEANRTMMEDGAAAFARQRAVRDT